jgi:hypothetical protein
MIAPTSPGMDAERARREPGPTRAASRSSTGWLSTKTVLIEPSM